MVGVDDRQEQFSSSSRSSRTHVKSIRQLKVEVIPEEGASTVREKKEKYED